MYREVAQPESTLKNPSNSSSVNLENPKLTLRETYSNAELLSGPYFPVFGLKTEIYFVNVRIQCKYGKIRTRKNSVFGHFLQSVRCKK